MPVNLGSIIWLASYPKAGNTWFRIFLTNLLSGNSTPASINDLANTPIASSRTIFDNATGLESSDLSHEEIDKLRPDVYKLLSDEAIETLFMKVHDACTSNIDGNLLFPREASKGVIYIIRNPLDVAVSFAHHSDITINESVKIICCDSSALCHSIKKLSHQLRQYTGTWNKHVLSWLESGIPTCLIRFEDMKAAPLETFEKAVRFAGLRQSREQIQKAIDFSSFDELKRQEVSNGFKECVSTEQNFFRKGTVGSWREELTDEEAHIIITTNKAVMRRFGYLDDNDVPVY